MGRAYLSADLARTTGFYFRSPQSLKKIGEFAIQGEGWGLAHNGQQLILSDGSAVLQFLDPQTFAQQKTLTVTLDGTPLAELNELEWLEAQAGRPARLLANIWQTDTIVVIDPVNGRVTAQLDCSRAVSARAARAARRCIERHRLRPRR